MRRFDDRRFIAFVGGLFCAFALACSGSDSQTGGHGGGIAGNGGPGGAAAGSSGAAGAAAGSSGGAGASGLAGGGHAGSGRGGTGAGGTIGDAAGTTGTPTGGRGGGGGIVATGGAAGTVATGGGTAGTGAGGRGGAAGAGGVATGGAGGGATTAAWCLPLSAHPMGVDWAKALIDSQMKANVSLTWQYPDGLFLHGVYLAYKRLNSAPYLAFIKKWADANVNGMAPYNSLDSMQPSIVLDDLYRETQDAKYGTTPMAIATRLETDYPKTTDGGYWHKIDAVNQLWGDGVFMDLPAYVSYGQLFNKPATVDVATNQLIIYDNHIAAPNNLHYHNWDGQQGSHSCCEWCRAEGWYEMSILMVLDVTPTTHANYQPLIAIVQRLAKGLAATQDASTGRWWQVMDKPTDSGNWLETSCTAMHTYFLSKASQKGYIDAATYAPLAIKGFMGEMQQVSNPTNVQIKDICPGTGVLTSPSAYYMQPKATNDNHGLGAFLLMYDQLTCR
jgi:unsaturated rhamnogalacturonyl hydrolase